MCSNGKKDDSLLQIQYINLNKQINKQTQIIRWGPVYLEHEPDTLILQFSKSTKIICDYKHTKTLLFVIVFKLELIKKSLPWSMIHNNNNNNK